MCRAACGTSAARGFRSAAIEETGATYDGR
jgi:hypothetical protein